MKLFLKCEEAAHVCDKSQYKEARFSEKLLFKVHILMCSFCRKYSSRNTKLTNVINTSALKTLTLEQKIKLKERLEVNLRNQ